MTLCTMRLRTSVTQNIFTRETCINLYMQIFSFPLQRLSLPVHKEFKQLFVYATEWKPYSLGRLRFTFTPNGKREFVPHDQVFFLIVVYCLLLLLKNKYFHASFIHKNCSGQFLFSYFLF